MPIISSLFLFNIFNPAEFIESTSPRGSSVITPVAMLPRILSLNCFSFVMSLKSLAFSIATAAWLLKAVSKSKSKDPNGSIPFLVSLLHSNIYPKVSSFAVMGEIIRLSSLSFFWIESFSFSEKMHPFLF